MINRIKSAPVLYISLSAAAALLLLTGFIIKLNWQQWYMESEPLHSSMETLGVLLAILMVLILLERKKRDSDNKSSLMAMGFLSMGILQGIHASSLTGQSFVFFYSMSALGGGFWFAMMLVSDYAPGRLIAESRWTPWLVGALSSAIGAAAVLYDDTLPAMVYRGQFTDIAIGINVVAGLFFAASAVRLLIDFHRSGKTEVLLFAFMAVLFSMAELTFQYSELWSAVWWYWHAIRLVAFVVVIGFLYTEYRSLTAELQLSLQDWENTFNTISDMITIHDKDLNILHANTAAKQVLGLPDLKISGAVKCFKYFHGTSSPPKDCPSCSCLRSGKPVVFEMFEPHINRYLEIRGMPQLDSEGRLIRLVHITRDITDHISKEKAIRLSEEKFSKVFRNSPTFILICTLDEGRIIEVNDTFLEAAGFKKEEVIGQKEMDLGIWDETSERDEMFSRIRESSEVNNMEVRFSAKSGQLLTVLLSAERLDIEDVPCVMAVALDITDRKKLEKQLVQAQKMEVVGQLAGGVAHDFNNILSAIISYGYLLNSDLAEDDPAREHVGKIMSLSDRASKITRGLLTFSRKQPVEIAPAGLNDIIQTVLQLLSKFITEDIEVRTELTSKDPVILADRTQIEQIIINLATNARDAMPDGGQIVVETDVVELDRDFVMSHGFGLPGTYALLSVGDNGAGMDAETRQKIFEPFFTTKDVGKGTGLGLSIVYGIMKQHNGYITVSGRPEGGTLFRMYFPLMRVKIEESQTENLAETTGRGETILLAEDEAELRESMKKILEISGYDVIEAADGEDAVQKFMDNRDRIQLIISDVVMPRKNGREAVGEITKISPDIKVIFTSGYTPDILEKKKIINDNAILVSKPISPDQFLAKIREVLEDEHRYEQHHTGS